jgi:hypothetical protein
MEVQIQLGNEVAAAVVTRTAHASSTIILKDQAKKY